MFFRGCGSCGRLSPAPGGRPEGERVSRSGCALHPKGLYGAKRTPYTTGVKRGFRWSRIAACTLTIGALFAAAVHASAARLPSRLTDADFWTLIDDLSETGGTFRSDNLLSNEARFQYVVADLVAGVKPGGVYIGVGPEQNFTYIAAVKPSIAFVVDIRRRNLDLHLLYKALFELSADRSEFVSRLFARKRPADLSRGATAAHVFDAYAAAAPSGELYERTLRDVRRQLMSKHGFALTAEDLRGIEHVYSAFYQYGPAIQYSSNEGAGVAYQPTYADLMQATDTHGVARGYLASDEAFGYVKELEGRNLVVPVVGDFAGSKAIRAVGAFLRERDATVSVFYLSNVEQYLRLQRSWNIFCANVATLPLDTDSTFVRAGHGGRVARGTAMTAELGAIAAEVENCGGR
jgi:hypothetical protein